MLSKLPDDHPVSKDELQDVISNFEQRQEEVSEDEALADAIVNYCNNNFPSPDVKDSSVVIIDQMQNKTVAQLKDTEFPPIVFHKLEAFVESYVDLLYLTNNQQAVKSYSIWTAIASCTAQSLRKVINDTVPQSYNRRMKVVLRSYISQAFRNYHEAMVKSVAVAWLSRSALVSPSGDLQSDVIAFAGKYENIVVDSASWTPLQAFTKYIAICSEAWKAENTPYYAPYTTVCQCSCSGKSFLAVNTKSTCAMSYTNLRDDEKDFTGIPKRSEIVADYFLNELKNVDSILLFYLSFFKCVLSNATITDLDSYFLHVNKNSFWKKVTEDSKKSISQQTTISKSIVNELCVEISKCHGKLQTTFLFVIDEARTMLDKECDGGKSLFSTWRSAIHKLSRQPVFFVVIDTTSRLSNFQPSQQDFHSWRHDGLGMELFPPFYSFPFTGAWPVEDTDLCKVEIPLENNSIVTFDLLWAVKFSRPYFFSLIPELIKQFGQGIGGGAMVWQELCKVAKVKISNGPPKTLPWTDRSTPSALLSCKYSLVSLDYAL
jgi:hypothetical protein